MKLRTYTCKIDNVFFESKQKFSSYLKNKYNLSFREYYHKYIIKSDDIPYCQCGCKEHVEWGSIGEYRKFKRYHHIRVKNPWGHNKEAIRKSAETRRQQYKNGERKIWCTGLKKENTKSLQSAAIKLSNRYTSEVKKEYSIRLSKLRKNGTVPTLYREKSSQWKGGISSIQSMSRSDIRLYKNWKYPILLRDKFKCTICNSNKKLHVHHDKETFSEILNKIIETYSNIDNFETKKLICDDIVKYHVENNVSGIVLCKSCHNKIHLSNT